MSAAEEAPALVLTAIPEERSAVARRLASSPAVVVVATGDGPRQAARGAAEAIARHRPAVLFGAGVAGALTPGLAVADILVSARVLDGAGEAPPPSRRLLEAVLAAPGTRAGTLLTIERPAVSAAEKAGLAASTGAPAACDMESAAWARAAAAAGVPYVILRAVSDAADEDLPRYLARCMNAGGGISRAAVTLRALLHPATIPDLLRMRRRVAACADRLGDALAAVVGGRNRP
jgi:adenosylhomocysteine nucleosidase